MMTWNFDEANEIARAWGCKQVGAIVHSGGREIATKHGSVTVNVQAAHDDAELAGMVPVNCGEFSALFAV